MSLNIKDNDDIWKKLSNLKELQKKGLISSIEFENRKLQLIDSMTGTKLISNNNEKEKEKDKDKLIDKHEKSERKYEKLEKIEKNDSKIISEKNLSDYISSNSSKKSINSSKREVDFKPINDLAVPLLDSLKQLNNGYSACSTMSRGSAGSPVENSPSATITVSKNSTLFYYFRIF